jgi:hypothetical protein
MLLGCPSKGYHTVLARRLWCDAFERQRFEADGRLEEPGLLDPVLDRSKKRPSLLDLLGFPAWFTKLFSPRRGTAVFNEFD